MNIDKELKRLSLHDSRFQKIIRAENSITIIVDWAKLDNLIEYGIDDFVILGKTVLKLKGIKKEQLKAYYDGHQYKLIDFPDNVEKYWIEVANTEVDDDLNTIVLDGAFTKDKEDYWVEWMVDFETFDLEWNTYVTQKEWKEGLLPND